MIANYSINSFLDDVDETNCSTFNKMTIQQFHEFVNYKDSDFNIQLILMIY